MRTLGRIAGRMLAAASVAVPVTVAMAQEPPASQPSEAASAAEAPVSTPSAMTDGARLSQAVRYYQLGERDEARRILATLVVSASANVATRQSARVYLAEILIVDGDIEGARGFLRQVLREDPTYTVDVFRHTPEVAGELVYVKALMVPVKPEPSSPPPPDRVVVTRPLSVWSPFGRYHFANDRPVRGLVYLTGVTSSAVASGFLFGMVHGNRTYKVNDTVLQSPEELQVRSSRRAQWVATGLFYGFWGVSIIDAQVHWRTVGLRASALPAAGRTNGVPGGQLEVKGAF